MILTLYPDRNERQGVVKTIEELSVGRVKSRNVKSQRPLLFKPTAHGFRFLRSLGRSLMAMNSPLSSLRKPPQVFTADPLALSQLHHIPISENLIEVDDAIVIP